MNSAGPSTSPPSLIPVAPVQLKSKWAPKAYLEPPKPYPPDVERLHEPEMIPNPAEIPDVPPMIRNPKKVRPRRTVDYNGDMTRWKMLKKMRPNPTYLPSLRPAPPYIIELLPPKAYPSNSSTSIATKFAHTSTNKVKFPVNVVAWTPEGRRVLTGSTSGEFTLWNGLTFNFETILQAHDSAVRAFQFSHNGSYLISTDQSGIIKYFQPNMNNLIAWNGHKEAIRGVSFSPDDARFATASDDQTIKLWDFHTRSEERVLSGHGWDVRCVEWHPTKGLLASGSKDNLVKFWDPRTGQALSTLHAHKGTIQAIQWNPNGATLATASRDQTVRVFDIRAMKELQLFKGHKKDVCSLAWHPVHHDLLASGGAEGSIMYWTLGHGAPRASIDQAHDSNVWALAWHPLGHILCSGSNDYTVRFWSRDRPGDVTKSGEKPPAGGVGGDDDDDDNYVPGLQSGAGGVPGLNSMGGGPGWNAPNMPTGGPDSALRQWEDEAGLNHGGGLESFIPGFGGPARNAQPPPHMMMEEPRGMMMQGQGQQWDHGGNRDHNRGGFGDNNRRQGWDDRDRDHRGGGGGGGGGGGWDQGHDRGDRDGNRGGFGGYGGGRGRGRGGGGYQRFRD